MIARYSCIYSLYADQNGKPYTLGGCPAECFSLGFQLPLIDKSNADIPDTDLVFNLLVDDDCCCGGTPEFSDEKHDLPLDELAPDNMGDDESKDTIEESKEFEGFKTGNEYWKDVVTTDDQWGQDFGTFGGWQSNDLINGMEYFTGSGGSQALDTGDLGGGSQALGTEDLDGGQWNSGERKRKKIHTPYYPGKEMYGDSNEDDDPVRETSESAAKRAKLERGELEVNFSNQPQTPDVET